MDLNTLLIGLAILMPYLLFFLYIKNIKNEEKEETIDEEAITSKLYELLNDEQSPLSKRLKDVDDSYQKFIGENASINTVLDDLKSWQITLNNILGSERKRGSLGELQVEQLLDIMEYKNGIHYETQKTIEGNKPDYTFSLPDGKIVNLDSKFPIKGWGEYNRKVGELDSATSEDARKEIQDELEERRKDYISVVKKHIDEISGKPGYISPENGTVDYLFMYIPLDSMYNFILESEISGKPALSYSLNKGVIITTPAVLFAYLSTISHAMSTFNIQDNVKEIVEAFKAFKNEWGKYTEQYETVQKSLDTTQKHFTALVDTRTNALNRKIDAMDELSVDGSVDNLEE